MSNLRERAPFEFDDPKCPPDWSELYDLHQEFERATDSDRRFELGKRITELSKRSWEYGRWRPYHAART